MTEEDLMRITEYGLLVRDRQPDEPRLAVARAIAAAWPARAAYIEAEIATRVEQRKGQGWTPARSAASKDASRLAKELKLYEAYAALILPYGARQPDLRRGFIGAIEIDLDVFVENGDRLMSRFPLLSVVLEGSASGIARLAECAALQHVTSLGIRCQDLGDDGIRQLVASPHLSNLRHLWTRGAGLGRRGYEHVIEATRTTLANLEMFSSSDNAIDQPQERQPSYDSISGFPVHETVGFLPEEGEALEAKYGYQKVLHWCSRFGPELEKWPYE